MRSPPFSRGGLQYMRVEKGGLAGDPTERESDEPKSRLIDVD